MVTETVSAGKRAREGEAPAEPKQTHSRCAEDPSAFPQAGQPRFLVGLALALSTALLLYLSFFPVDCGWLGWFALVPWLVLVRSRLRPWKLYLLVWVTGLCFYWPVLQWMRVADPRMYATWAMLATYCACYFPLTLWLLRWLDRRTALPLVLTLPVVWTALEMLRAQAMTGFPWYFLAHTQHDFLALIQISDLTGAYGVSFLVAAVNGLLFDVLWRYAWFRNLAGEEGQFALPPSSRPALVGQGAVVLVALLGALGYGAWRLNQDRQEPGPRLALVQGNMPQGALNDASGPAGEKQKKASESAGTHFVRLSDLAGRYQPDLIVWPETSFPGEWKQIARDHPRTDLPEPWRKAESHWEDEGLAVAERWRSTVLLGANLSELQADNQPRRYNSALLINRQGRIGGRYDKIHRVPFGEYVPLREWIPGMNRFAPYDYDYEVVAGQAHPALSLLGSDNRAWAFGVNICFEDTDPRISTPYVTGEPAVNFLVNISNDGWFKGTAEHEQHLALCRFRAIECRRGIARAVNMGISAVIDGNGRVLRPEPLKLLAHLQGGTRVWRIPAEKTDWSELPVREWGEYKSVAGVLLATVPIDSRTSLYARWGDWLPWTCWGLLGLATVVRFRPPGAGQQASTSPAPETH